MEKMCWFPVEKQEVKISTEKYEIGSQRNRPNIILQVLKQNYLLKIELSSPTHLSLLTS